VEGPQVQATPDPDDAHAHDHTAVPGVDPTDGYTYFVPWQAAILEAACGRLIPTDDLGPGAADADVVHFIDRQLTAQHHFRGYRGGRYDLGPYVEGEPTQGDQSGMSMRERFRLGIFGMEAYAQQRHGTGFAQLDAETQDAILADMEAGTPDTFGGATLTSSPTLAGQAGTEGIEAAGQTGIGAKAFFDLLLAFTIAGYFADPVQGGNRDMAGWKLIGFPGAHIGYPEEILRYGEEFVGDYISLAQYQQRVSGGS
jgi:gluconate 2-dehydrogenase gamma chain